jgi:hypothetical protein
MAAALGKLATFAANNAGKIEHVVDTAEKAADVASAAKSLGDGLVPSRAASSDTAEPRSQAAVAASPDTESAVAAPELTQAEVEKAIETLSAELPSGALDEIKDFVNPHAEKDTDTPQTGGSKFLDSFMFTVCLAAALKLTDWTMLANVDLMDAYAKVGKKAEKYTAQPGLKYVRLDATFWKEVAAPLVLQGAVTTCYCVLLYLAASATVSLVAFLVVAMKTAAMFKGKSADWGTIVMARSAMRVVLENSLASAEMMIMVSLTMAATTLTAGGVTAIVAVAGKGGKWFFKDDKYGYASIDFVKTVSTLCTWSGLPAAVGFMFWGTRLRTTIQTGVRDAVDWTAKAMYNFFASIAKYFKLRS